MGLTEQLGVGRAGAHSAAVGGSAAYGCGVPLAGTVRPYIWYIEVFRLAGAA